MTAVANAAEQFQLKGAICSVAPFGLGHIHDTYRVDTDQASYLLQRINADIFKRWRLIFFNFSRLGPLIEQSLIVPLTKADTGALYFHDYTGVWRMQHFAQDTWSPQKITDEAIAVEVAHGFGRFNRACAQLNPDDFHEVISDFHDLPIRLVQLDEARHNAQPVRLKQAAELLEQSQEFRWLATGMSDLWRQGLPVRVCHNDTKANNVLLSNATNQFCHVVDLDTVGPGTPIYDFGDMMRTMLSPTTESEADEERISLRVNMFQAITKAYLAACGDQLSILEKQSLVFGGMYMTYLMGVRFLADFLNGDVYYKVSFEGENLIRARNQFVMLKEIFNLRTQLEEIVRCYE